MASFHLFTTKSIMDSIESISLLLPLVLAFLIIVVVFGLAWQHHESSSSLPPGSFGFPIIGESIQFLIASPTGTPIPYFCKRLLCYGKVFKTHLLGTPTVVSMDPELNIKLLQSEGTLVRSSYPWVFRQIIGPVLRLEGTLHKRIRNLVSSFLSPANLQTHFLDDLQDHAVRILQSWKGRSIVDAQVEARKFAFTFIAKKTTGLDPENPTTLELLKDMEIIVKGLSSIPINLPGTTYGAAIKARKRLSTTVENLITSTKFKEDSMDGGPSNYAALLLQDMQAMGLENGREIQVADHVFGLLFSGYMVLALLLTSLFKLLSTNPRVYEALRAEHLEIRKNKHQNEKITWAEYKGMRFTTNVINETLRLTNIVHNVHRESLQPINHKGITIPEGWRVLLNISSIHLDAKLFTEPLKFDPWRWQDDASCNWGAFRPFGGGSRLCLGSSLAKMEASIFLHYLVTLYSWELVADDGVLDRMSGLVPPTFRKGLPIRLQALS